MTTLQIKSLTKVITTVKQKSNMISSYLFDQFMDKIDYFLIVSLIFSVAFGVIKTVFFTGYAADSYQIFALSVEKWIITGTQDDLFNIYYANNRIIYPLIVALVHVIIPIDISLLACFINLIFAFSCIILMRKLLRIHEFSDETINLFSLFTLLSYNFLNFWFNILTDLIALFFFLLMLIYLELYLSNKTAFYLRRFSYLTLSFISFIFALLTREVYLFAMPLFLAIIKPRKLRIIVLVPFFWLTFLLIDQNPSEFLLAKHFLPESFWDEFVNRDYASIFALFGEKWEDPILFQDFIKGLLKVGLLPTVFIILTAIIILVINKLRVTIEQITPDSESTSFSFRSSIIIIWFFFFFLIYSLFYANIYSASGLRYWLPISWIPFVYVAKIIIENVQNRHIKLMIILFLCLYPISWSSAELNINRNFTQGTGPLFQQNTYSNDMSDLHSILEYDSRYINIRVINGSYFETVAFPAAYEEAEVSHHRSRFSFPLWINITRNVTIEVKLRTLNGAYWGILLYPVRSDYASGYGSLAYEQQYLVANSTFQIYKFVVENRFLARKLSLTIGGVVNATVIWDYIKIYEGNSTVLN